MSNTNSTKKNKKNEKIFSFKSNLKLVEIWIEIIVRKIRRFNSVQCFTIGFFADRQKSVILNEKIFFLGVENKFSTHLEWIKHFLHC